MEVSSDCGGCNRKHGRQRECDHEEQTTVLSEHRERVGCNNSEGNGGKQAEWAE